MFKSETNESINLGKWTHEKLNSFLHKASGIKDTGKRMDFLSKRFLGTAYKESTLIGDINTPEIFVINLKGLDCFTFIDYIEAIRLSDSFNEFRENLKKVRYQHGKVAFKNRNHFFTNWIEYNSDTIFDVTGQIGGRKVKTVKKLLNKKEDGTRFISGIVPEKREIKYIPSDAVNGSIINKMKTGDYVGIYSDLQGLDVSHVGIFIRQRNKVYLRHASSLKKYRRVANEDFRRYIAGRSGILVLRPKD
ncbi:MAG: DUF1460 domain-containing protein [Thermodesulfovibrio sp.]|nr:DUF1460 domain-containing protein [Thermodesulfovibrio sp.]